MSLDWLVPLKGATAAMSYMTRRQSPDDDTLSFKKAHEKGERTFTLRSQDRSSPKTIAFWIMENIETAPAQKLLDALEDALLMREWPNRKNAD